jgi:hypothetical protein
MIRKSGNRFSEPIMLKLQGAASLMLTARWQQGVTIPGQHFNQEDFVHDDSVQP